MLVLRAGLALLLLLVLVAPAGAQTRTIEEEHRGWFPSHQLQGPRLSGDDVVWAEQSSEGRVVMAERPGRRRRLHESPPDGRERMHFDAAGGRAALTAWAERCPPSEDIDDPCSRYNGESPVDGVIHAGSLDGPLSRLGAGCTATSAVIGADALALACYADAWRLIEEPGQERRLDVFGVRLAPGLIAAIEPPGNPLVVRRRPGGEELLRVVSLPSETRYDLAPDGAVAYVLDDQRIGWSSPQEPDRHTIDVPGRALGIRIEGDRIAVASYGEYGLRLTVVRRDGSPVATHTVTRTSGDFDFDGTRLAWARRPCARTTIQVWALEDPPPPAPGTRCTMLEPLVMRARVRRDGRVRIPTVCPIVADAGCAGQVSASLRYVTRSGRRRETYLRGDGVFEAETGEHRELSFRIGRRTRARARRGRLILSLTPPPADPGLPRLARIELRLPRRR